MKSAFLATKSVSQLSSSSAWPEWATRPLAVVRPARLPTSLAPLMRRNSTALSKSPAASSSAFLQSIIPAPVSSRSFLTSAAVKFDIVLSRSVRAARAATPRAGNGSPQSGWAATARGAAAGPRSALGGRRGLGLALEQLALPLGERFVTGDRARLRLLLGGAGAQRLARAGDQPVGHCVGDDPGQQRGRPDRVVVARDREVDLVRVAVRVEHGDHGDVQLAGLVDRDVL